MFNALLMQQRELLGFVSRSHLQLEAASSCELTVTNMSQNITLVGTRMLKRGESARMADGDTLSFAAQVELLQGAEVAAAAAAAAAAQSCSDSGGDRERVSIAPFLTFQLMGSGASAAPQQV